MAPSQIDQTIFEKDGAKDFCFVELGALNFPDPVPL